MSRGRNSPRQGSSGQQQEESIQGGTKRERPNRLCRSSDNFFFRTFRVNAADVFTFGLRGLVFLRLEVLFGAHK